MSTPAAGPKVQDIWVAHDAANDGVTVTPGQVDRGSTVRFLDPNKGKLRIVFLSPTGKESETVLDSHVAMMGIDGIYHFNCFFIPAGGTQEISPKNGGVIVISPPLPVGHP